MALSDIDRYKNKVATSLGWVNTDGLDKKIFIWRNASSHSSVHSKFSLFLMEDKKANALSPAQDKKRERAARRPISC